MKMNKEFWVMVLSFAAWLTLTMFLFEVFEITPERIPYGVVGWTLIVELPRVVLGFFISDWVRGKIR